MKSFIIFIIVATMFFGVFACHAVAADTAAPTTRGIEESRDAMHRNLMQQLELEQLKLKEATNDIDRIRDSLRNITGRIETSAEAFHAAAASLDDQRALLTLEKIGGEARMKAIEEEIAHASANASNRAANDSAIVEFSKVVESRKKQMDSTQSRVETGMATPADANQAVTALAEAQAQLAIQKERVVATNGGDIIINLQKQLADLRIASAEREARLAYIQSRIEKFADGEVLLEKLESCQEDKLRFRGRINQIDDQIDLMDRTPRTEPSPQ